MSAPPSCLAWVHRVFDGELEPDHCGEGAVEARCPSCGAVLAYCEAHGGRAKARAEAAGHCRAPALDALARNLLEPVEEVAREREITKAVLGRVEDLERAAREAIRVWRSALAAARRREGRMPPGQLEAAMLVTDGLAEVLDDDADADRPGPGEVVS